MRVFSDAGADTAPAAPPGEVTRPKGREDAPRFAAGDERESRRDSFLTVLLRALSAWPV